MADKPLEEINTALHNKLQQENAERVAVQQREDLLKKQAKFAADLAEFKQKRILPGRDGKGITDWEHSNQQAEAALDQGSVTAAHDWRSAMLALLATYSSLNRAISNEVTEKYYAIKAGSSAPPGLDELVSKVPPLKEITLPTLMHHAKLNDKNELVVSLERGDEGQMVQEIEALFKKGVTMWLLENDYEPDPANKDQFVYVGNDPDIPKGTVLTNAAFKELKDDPDSGLDKYLSEHSELEYRSGPSPS